VNVCLPFSSEAAVSPHLAGRISRERREKTAQMRRYRPPPTRKANTRSPMLLPGTRFSVQRMKRKWSGCTSD